MWRPGCNSYGSARHGATPGTLYTIGNAFWTRRFTELNSKSEVETLVRSDTVSVVEDGGCWGFRRLP